MLHHADALIPIFASRVDTAGRIGIEMGELPLDRIRVPHAHLVEERGCCRSEPMRRHLLAAIADATQCRAPRLLGHAPPGGSKRRKHNLPMAGEAVQYFQHFANLPQLGNTELAQHSTAESRGSKEYVS